MQERERDQEPVGYSHRMPPSFVASLVGKLGGECRELVS